MTHSKACKIGFLSLRFAASLAACFYLALDAHAIDDRDVQTEESAIQAGTGELKGLEDQLKASAEREKSLDAEIGTLYRQTKAMSERLISMAARIQAREAKITGGEERLIQLDLEEKAVRNQLRRRRKTLAKLLVGLQRLEQNPPPALIVKPGDALSALRSAMLLGAIVPKLKAKAGIISRNLSRLVELQAATKLERKGLEDNVARLKHEHEEIKALLAQKLILATRTREELEAHKALTRKLASQAKDLRELIKALVHKRKEREESERLRAEEFARQHSELKERKKIERKRRVAILNAPRIAFSKAKGTISYPAQGERLYRFFDKMPDGTRSKGLALSTRPYAQVTAPADGTVVYADEFRSYGRLLIIDVGEGYHLLLAGLGNISVGTGQAVRAGEPVGSMGEVAAEGVSGAEAGAGRPVLFVEFRRNGNSIDSRPWWAGSSS